MKEFRGQITIVLSLLLVVLISFTCTALRSAQSAGSRYLFSLAAEATTKSLFGVYDTRAWEQYRILMLTDQVQARRIGEECAAGYEQNGTLFPLEIEELRITDTVTLAENGALGWETSALSYMKAKMPMELLSGLMDQMGWLDGLDQMGRWMTDFRDVWKPLTQLEEKLCGLEEKISDFTATYQQGKLLLTEFQRACDAVRQLVDAVPLSEAEEIETEIDPEALHQAWTQLESSYQKIRQYLQGSGWKLEELIEDAEENLGEIRALRQQIENLLHSLSNGGQGALAAMADLGGYLSGLSDRFAFLEALPAQLKEKLEYLGRISQMDLPTVEEVVKKTGVGQATLETLQGLAEGLLGSSWSPDPLSMMEGTGEDEENADHLLRLKSWLEQGILMLVLEKPDQVSDRRLNRVLLRSEREEEAAWLDRAYDSLLYGEYALRYTNAYGGKSSDGLCYETEYLIAGQWSDRANLTSVAYRLLMVRSAANFLYLWKDTTGKEEMKLMAASISAALGGYVPEGLVSVLLMVVWAMAEAVCDIRALFSGRQVPFWKEDATWNLRFSQLWTLLEDGFIMTQSRAEGMAYKDYLRLLLFLVPLKEKCYRTMEVAEENLRSESPGFLIDKSWCRATVTLVGKSGGRKTEISLTYGYE